MIKTMILHILAENMIPLCLLIGLGFVAGRWLDVNLHSMAIIAIYIFAPVVNFGAVARLRFDASYLLLPVVLYAIAVTITLIGWHLSRRMFRDNTANLVAMSSSTGNTGYFGAPIVLGLFGPEVLGIYLLMNFAIVLSEISVGYYYGARGNYSMRDSLKKLISLPVIYALVAGLAWNFMDLPLPDAFTEWWERFTGAWVIIGMMLMGVALGKIEKFTMNPRLLAATFFMKFVLWPVFTCGFAFMDKYAFGLYDHTAHMLLVIIGVVPLAGNLVAYAAQLDLRPSEVAVAVIGSTLFAALYIPLVYWLLQSLL